VTTDTQISPSAFLTHDLNNDEKKEVRSATSPAEFSELPAGGEGHNFIQPVSEGQLSGMVISGTSNVAPCSFSAAICGMTIYSNFFTLSCLFYTLIVLGIAVL
jgi:hypothetical protein